MIFLFSLPLFSIKLFRDILCFSLYALIAFTCICNVETFLNGNIDRDANMMQSRPNGTAFVLRKINRVFNERIIERRDRFFPSPFTYKIFAYAKYIINKISCLEFPPSIEIKNLLGLENRDEHFTRNKKLIFQPIYIYNFIIIS